MIWKLVFGVALFVVFQICAVASSIVTNQILNAVNERLPPEQRIGPWFWYWGKYCRLYREYRRLYPDGRLIKKGGILIIVGATSFLAAVTCIVLYWRDLGH
jgi:hypothetical protein